MNNGSDLLSTLLGVAAYLLAISLFIQIIQEIYKYLRKTKTRTYTRVLIDMLGPYASRLLQPDALPNLQARGPFQFRRRAPKGALLPMNKPTLAAALERTAADWTQRTLKSLELESNIQSDVPDSISPEFHTYLNSICDIDSSAPGYEVARSIRGLLIRWELLDDNVEAEIEKPPAERQINISPQLEVDAAALLMAFREQFLPQVEIAKRDFDQLEQNFEYSYKRQNLRLTFTLAFIVAAMFDLSFQRLWITAGSLSADEAVALAERVTAIADNVSALNESDAPGKSDSTAKNSGSADGSDAEGNDEEQMTVHLRELVAQLTETAATMQLGNLAPRLTDWSRDTGVFSQGTLGFIRFLFGALLTAVLVSFGAPVWNDLAKALLHIRSDTGGKAKSPEES